MGGKRKSLWICPRCGHRFVSRNLWHSCGRYRLAEHFTGKTPTVRRLFDLLRREIRLCGPVTVYAQKTRIVFQGRVRFATTSAKQRWLDGTVWLTRPVRNNARVRKIERVMPRAYIHHFRLAAPGDIDEELRQLLREAYAVGQRMHLQT